MYSNWDKWYSNPVMELIPKPDFQIKMTGRPKIDKIGQEIK